MGTPSFVVLGHACNASWFQILNCNSLLIPNGTPLQYSCLENPMDGGGWWVAIYGVARTIAFISHTSKVMLKILQAKLQQYVNRELPSSSNCCFLTCI